MKSLLGFLLYAIAVIATVRWIVPRDLARRPDPPRFDPERAAATLPLPLPRSGSARLN